MEVTKKDAAMIHRDPRARRKRTKIAFFGNFGELNLGNEGTLKAILYNLRKRMPQAEMFCISTGPEAAAKIYGIPAVPIHPEFIGAGLLQANPLARLMRKILLGIPLELYRWIWAVRILRDTDMLILPGTQFLSDNLSSPWGWPYLAFRWSVAASIVNCKLLFVSVGAGPLRHRLSRLFVRSCLGLAAFRSYRDHSSKQCIDGIGFSRPDDPVHPDLAFSLPTPATDQPPAGEERRPVVAVGVKDYHGQYGPWPRELSARDTYRRYLSRMAAFIAWLLDRRYTVRLVIGDVSYDTEVLSDLRQALRALNVALDDRLLPDEPIESMDMLMRKLSSCDIIVSPRFHNIIFGLLLDKPVLAISYHEKFSGLLESVNLAGCDVPIDDADAALLIERFSELDGRRDELTQSIKLNVDRQKLALDRQYRDIVALLDAGPPPTE